MPVILSGQMDLGSAMEDVALAGNTDVASFTVDNTTDTASDFTATIDWGDGTTSAGTIVGSNGSFIVEGGHTYLDEGFPLATVTIIHTADNTQIAPAGTIAVADTDNISVQGTTLSGTPNTPLTNVTVATFTTTNTANTTGDFVATIDWGDGTTTAGTIVGSNGSFSVQGTHTYTAAGDDTITIFVNDNHPDAAFNFGTSQALIGVALGGHVVLNAATEDQALGSGTTVATFADGTSSDTAGDFTALIDWGDGTTSAGTVTGSSGSFTVEGDHTYADEGNPLATVTVTRTSDSATAVLTGNVAVAEADFLTATPETIGEQPGVLINNVVVATFDDVNTAAVPGDFTATIDWGDGTTTAGTVSGSGGSFSVSGSHTYATAGRNSISITLADNAPSTVAATADSTAFIGFAAGDVLLTSATERVALAANTAIATFTDGNFSDTAGDFTAMIDWGDGTTSAGTVTGANGSFTVSGGHTYADEAVGIPVTATIMSSSYSTAVVETGHIDVGEHDVLSAHGTTLTGARGQAIANAIVASFTDTDTAAVAGDFTATIDWGDGTTSAGTISGSGGSFNVLGTHTYARVGQDAIQVHVADDAPGTATADATSTASIGLGPSEVPPQNDFSGNGLSAILWQNIDGTPAIWAVDGTSLVSGSNVGVNPGATWHVIGSGDFDGDSKADILWQNTDGTIAEWFMNGSSLIAGGNVGFNPGSAWHAIGAADFNGDGKSDILWQNNDGTAAVWLMNGLNIVSGADVGVNPGSSWHVIGAGDFNGDGKADILWQNNDGTVAEWFMNGTTLINGANVGFNPGSNWHAIGAGDFNGDGKADILWQNADGTAAVWLMNGTSLIAGANVGVNPGPLWHALTTGDFNGDGKADIVWQNTDGTPAVWLMNGTSVISGANVGSDPGSNWHVIPHHDVLV